MRILCIDRKSKTTSANTFHVDQDITVINGFFFCKKKNLSNNNNISPLLYYEVDDPVVMLMFDMA
jgi:hypothetical protein